MNITFSHEALDLLTEEQAIKTLVKHRLELSQTVSRLQTEIHRHQTNITAITSTLCALALHRSNH